MRNCRFTLVELLIVTAIIAVLAGMLLPALNRARARANTIHCLSNCRQTGMALHLYADLYGGTFPVVHTGTFEHHHELSPPLEWFEPLTLCGYDPGYLRCPSDPAFDAQAGRQSYMMNAIFTFGRRIFSLRSASSRIVMAERGGETAETAETHQCYDGMCAVQDYESMLASRRHGGQANYLFADGHVETLRLEETVPDPADPEGNGHFVPEWVGPAYLETHEH